MKRLESKMLTFSSFDEVFLQVSKAAPEELLESGKQPYSEKI